ncbi:Ipi1p KNAG_0C05320 [Huiozyma naganishii CBS 8797]|uniref:Pre-rRNA-processing protein n=1 Tax=Huiozyma naganishii (strain ATCC MYA-139 / BCRC 22969 / CBS 8797 / KCTC 17520 / NBRC 10181 / NCYC 3082 / Yp74L-3) TaxID=1071383 RepID=J7R459_HUIN7|nr:hypothetical protein KNAG_0C05320 [Kazachstania naganishii CBS 8797]CCK69630.1 hypothetical protein KNAG_0C05320 [Kazachstania naganishii CBS 8797]
MTKSRKQKQKKKDFLKKKLKVGKTAPKPSNVTDTSYVARTITIRNQHLDHHSDDLIKRLPLLRHHNETVRKETLQHFIKCVPKIIRSKIMTPLLKQSIPLICDNIKSVRDSLLELIEEIGLHDEQVLQLHCNVFVLYISMSMTHIVPRIQCDSTRFLLALLQFSSHEIVKHAWTKLLNGNLTVLGWNDKIGANQTSGSLQTRKRDSKNIKTHLDCLYKLIEYGCTDPTLSEEGPKQSNKYLIPETPQPYAQLKLFVRSLKSQDPSVAGQDPALANQDLATRRALFAEQYLPNIQRQLPPLISDGGDCGKSAHSIELIIGAEFGSESKTG